MGDPFGIGFMPLNVVAANDDVDMRAQPRQRENRIDAVAKLGRHNRQCQSLIAQRREQARHFGIDSRRLHHDLVRARDEVMHKGVGTRRICVPA
jgi:hypothetical protein